MDFNDDLSTAMQKAMDIERVMMDKASESVGSLTGIMKEKGEFFSIKQGEELYVNARVLSSLGQSYADLSMAAALRGDNDVALAQAAFIYMLQEILEVANRESVQAD